MHAYTAHVGTKAGPCEMGFAPRVGPYFVQYSVVPESSQRPSFCLKKPWYAYFMSLMHLSDPVLIANFRDIVIETRLRLVLELQYIAEIERRKLFFDMHRCVLTSWPSTQWMNTLRRKRSGSHD